MNVTLSIDTDDCRKIYKLEAEGALDEVLQVVEAFFAAVGKSPTPAALDALATRLEQNTAGLDTAVQGNTPTP